MSRLSELAVAKRSVTLLLAFGLFVAGISAWGSLQQELLPNIDFPIVTVVATYPGVGAEDVAEQVTKPIERSVGGVARLESLQSTSADSIALVVAQFSFGTDTKETVASIQENLARVGLPANITPQVSAFNINSSPVVIASIAATSPDGLEAAARIARTEMVPAIQSVEGVAQADLTGGLEQQLIVTLDPAKLSAANVSSQQVVQLLQANNLTIPSGQLSSDGQRIPISTLGQFGSAADVANLVVGFRVPSAGPGTGAGGTAASAPSGGQPSVAPVLPTPIRLADLGTVEAVGAATTGYARTNGQPALTLTVTKTSTANTVQVADDVTAKLHEIAAAHPGVVTVASVSDQSSFIKESQTGLLREGGLGALFAVATIFLFLGSLRSTLVAAISIPLSILTALVLMQLTGISLNIMTLGGLAVAVGRVVDDAIVVLENIYRHRSLGEDRMTAVLRGPREVAGAITASTLTTVAVFLPLGFVGGLVSQFFLPFALTVTFALLASLICALTVVPVLAYLFIGRVSVNVDETGEPRRSFWVHVYVPVITTALRNRRTQWAVLIVAAVLFVASASLVPSLPTQFINAGSDKILAVVVAPPTGTSSKAVLDQATRAETILLGRPEVELVQTSVPAEGATGFSTLLAALNGRPSNSATITVRLDPETDLAAEQAALDDALAPVATEGYAVTISEAAGFTSNNLNVIVSGPDPAAVATASDAVVAELATRTDLANVRSDAAKANRQVQITVDPNKALGVGSTAAQVAGEVRSALSPTTATTVTLDGGNAADVVVQLDPAATTSVDDLQALPVGTTTKVPLGSIATIAEVDAQGSITRIDQAPAASISGQVTSKDTGAVSKSVQASIDGLVASGAIPAGVDVRLAGVTQQQNEAFGGLFASMGVAILLVYVMMVLAFNSLVTPFIILFSLPLATIGAFIALYVTGRPIGVSALIGMLMLIGIVVTNAIVLLDLVERLRSQGESTHQALIEGGKTRVRPILMTAIATILALIPLAAGFNQGSIIAAELGTVVIGGLFSSTFLTLLVIPVIYSLVDGLKRRVGASAPEPMPSPAEGTPA